MKIFALYTPEEGRLFRVWERSWRLRGWQPQIMTRRELSGKSNKAAAKSRGGKLSAIISPRVINFAFKRPRKARLVKPKLYGSPGWESAPLVIFPQGVTEEVILKCGRPL